jgi:hypothetical protein
MGRGAQGGEDAAYYVVRTGLVNARHFARARERGRRAQAWGVAADRSPVPSTGERWGREDAACADDVRERERTLGHATGVVNAPLPARAPPATLRPRHAMRRSGVAAGETGVSGGVRRIRREGRHRRGGGGPHPPPESGNPLPTSGEGGLYGDLGAGGGWFVGARHAVPRPPPHGLACSPLRHPGASRDETPREGCAPGGPGRRRHRGYRGGGGPARLGTVVSCPTARAARPGAQRRDTPRTAVRSARCEVRSSPEAMTFYS